MQVRLVTDMRADAPPSALAGACPRPLLRAVMASHCTCTSKWIFCVVLQGQQLPMAGQLLC